MRVVDLLQRASLLAILTAGAPASAGFGGGIRRWLGMAFALHELKVIHRRRRAPNVY